MLASRTFISRNFSFCFGRSSYRCQGSMLIATSDLATIGGLLLATAVCLWRPMGSDVVVFTVLDEAWTGLFARSTSLITSCWYPTAGRLSSGLFSISTPCIFDGSVCCIFGGSDSFRIASGFKGGGEGLNGVGASSNFDMIRSLALSSSGFYRSSKCHSVIYEASETPCKKSHVSLLNPSF